MSDITTISRRERKKLTTKTQLLAAARRLFAEKTVAGTTIDDITEAADVARATFFNYFPSKNAILQDLWLEQISGFGTSVDKQLARRASTFDRLEHIFGDFVKELSRRPAYYKAVTGELELAWNAPEIVKTRVDRFHETLVRLVEAGIAQGDIRTDYDRRFLAQMIGGTYISILREWRLDPDYDLAGRFGDAARFLADALAPPDAQASARKPPRRR